MRLIDADALMDRFGEPCHSFADAIDDMPTIDAVPVVHARWEDCYPDDEVMRKTVYRCSKCQGSVFMNFAAYTRFCPGCGAKMDGGTNE